MATNKDNLLTNRELLLSILCEYADRASEALQNEVVKAVEPLARGGAFESSVCPDSVAMNTATPEDVQAIALGVVATFSASDPSRGRQISEALSEGFAHPSATVRRGAYAAASRLQGLSAEHTLPVLMGLRDPDPSAAGSAFVAFANQKEWSLTRPMWKLFLLAVGLSEQSTDANLRCRAAYAVREMLANAPTGSIRKAAQSLLDGFSKDVARSVREAAR